MGTPYVIANAVEASGSSSYNVAVSGAAARGDGVAVVLGVGGTAPPAVTLVSDSKGNLYTQQQQSSTSPYLAAYTSTGNTALTTSDTITVTFASAATGGFGVLAIGAPGLPNIDVATAIATGSSAAPSVSGTPTGGGETAVACFAWANGGGAGTISAPFTQLAQAHPTGGAFTTAAYDVGPAAGSSLTAAATITSGAWRALILTFTPPWYMTNASFINSMDTSNHTVTSQFFAASRNFSIGNAANSVTSLPAGYTTTPVMKYISYGQFWADVTGSSKTVGSTTYTPVSGGISASYTWLMYDTESWNPNPPSPYATAESQAEIDDPWTYMASFITLAHAHGFKVILAPGRDLGNDASSVNPKHAGETLDAWYTRTGIATSMATAGADIVHIQNQADTLTGSYLSFFGSGFAQSQAVSAAIPVSGAVSTTYGTDTQMAAAEQSLQAAYPVAGIWLNASSGTIAQAVAFLVDLNSAIEIADNDFATGTDGKLQPVTAFSFDAVSGTDAASVHAAFTSTDTGHGTDAGESLQAAFTSTDTGHGTEAGAVGSVPVSGADTVHGTDAGEALHTAFTSADTAHGTDGGELAAVAKSSADTLAGSDLANMFGSRFSNVLLDGVGTVNFMTKNSAGVIIGGADTHGYYRSSDDGDHWQSINKGVGGIGSSDSWRQSASIAWSVTETTTLYSCTGEAGAGGGLLVSTDGGNSWTMRTTVPQFAGNHQFAPLPSGGAPRSTGRLIAQDGGFLFLATYAQGVLRSANNGTDNFPVACTMAGSAPGSNYYARSLIADPNNAGTLYVAMYDYNGTGTFGHVWKCTSDGATTPNFTKLAASPASVEELVVVGTYLYAVAGSGGVSRSTDGGTTWSSLNGSGVPTAGGQDWFSIDGYVDGSGNHVIFICDSNPASASQCIISLTIPSTFPGSGTITYANLTGSVQLTTMPPDGRTWWNTGGACLGRVSWQNGSVVVDASNLSNVKLYACGPGGFFRNIGGAGWTVCSNGQAGFPGRSVACDPNNAGTFQLTATDWGTFSVTDGIAASLATTIRVAAPGAGSQGYGLSYDPSDSTTYAAFGDKGVAPTWGTNSSGNLSYRASGVTSWTDSGLTTAMGTANVPLGVLGLRDGSATKMLLAAVWNGGVWRGVWGGASYAWTQVASTFCNTSAAPGGGNQFIFAHPAGSQYVYLFDPDKGVYRSNNYGAVSTWVQVWAVTTTDKNSLAVTASETVPGEIWVSASGSLYKITGAHTGTVAGATATLTGPLTLPGSAQAGCLAAKSDGTIYVSTEDVPGSAGTGIFATTDHGATWFDAVGDGSLALADGRPVQMVIAADGRLYLAGSNVVTQGYPLPSGSPSVSGADFLAGTEASSLAVTLSDSDTGLGTDAGTLAVTVTSADSAHGTDAGEKTAFTTADTAHGADAGEQIAVSASSADTFHGTDAGEAVATAPSSADTAHGTDAGESLHAAFSDSDTVHAADAGSSPSGNFPVADSDAVRFQDSEIAYPLSPDLAAAAEAALIAVLDADVLAGAETGRMAGAVQIASADVLAGAEAAAVAGTGTRTFSDTDLAHGTEAVAPFALASSDAGVSAENLATHAGTAVPQSGIDVWTTIPDNLFLRGGDGIYNLIWHPGLADEVTVIAGAPLSRGLLELARELAALDTLVLARDSDSVTAAEAATPLASVSGMILTTGLAAEIPGRTGAPGQFGWAQGYPVLSTS